MDLLFEIIFSIVFEGSIEVAKEKTVPMWLRIICGIIALLTFLFVIGIIGALAIFMWNQYYHLPSILFLIIDLILIIYIIKEIRKLKTTGDEKQHEKIK